LPRLLPQAAAGSSQMSRARPWRTRLPDWRRRVFGAARSPRPTGPRLCVPPAVARADPRRLWATNSRPPAADGGAAAPSSGRCTSARSPSPREVCRAAGPRGRCCGAALETAAGWGSDPSR